MTNDSVIQDKIDLLEKQKRCYYLHDHVDGEGKDWQFLFQSPRNQPQFLLVQEFINKMQQTPPVFDGALWLKCLGSCLVYPTTREFLGLCDEDYSLPANLIAPVCGIVVEQQERLNAARKKA